MRRFLGLFAFSLGLGGQIAFAQVLPEHNVIPPPIFAQAQAQHGRYLLKSTGWQIDFDRDGDADWLVQTLYGGEGNSFNATYIVYRADPSGYTAVNKLDLLGTIKQVRLEGRVIVIVQTRLLPGDARCCPSGEAEARFQL
jgi:hypothetical protein